jgi:hypothetical protein
MATRISRPSSAAAETVEFCRIIEDAKSARRLAYAGEPTGGGEFHVTAEFLPLINSLPSRTRGYSSKEPLKERIQPCP